MTPWKPFPILRSRRSVKGGKSARLLGSGEEDGAERTKEPERRRAVREQSVPPKESSLPGAWDVSSSPRAEKAGSSFRTRRTFWHESIFRHFELCDPHLGIDAGSAELAEEGGRSRLGLARGAADGDGVPGRLLLRCRVGPRLDDLHIIQL